ncbi:hypothetical protein EDB19DRAFT_1826912 [Suillus lakei]|nr:hypothetical protein EDB19DRAFT_1826912 [Suillus lakei]
MYKRAPFLTHITHIIVHPFLILMGRRRKSSPEQQEGRQWTKHVHYLRLSDRNMFTGILVMNATKHSAGGGRDREPKKSLQATLNAFDTLDEILSRTYTGGSRHHNGCQAHVGAILQDIDAQGWSIVRPEFLEQVSEATALLNDTEALSTSVANLEAHLWLAAVEQILSLMDQEPGALDHALFNDRLFIAENIARSTAKAKCQCNDNTQDGAPPGNTTTDMEPIKAKRNRTAGDKPLKLWNSEWEKFLREFIQLEGCGDAMLHQTCQGLPRCLNEAVICCRDCKGLQLYCQGCTVVQHIAMLLHVMEIWMGTHFQHISLHNLGLRVQLGHPPGVMCCNPAPAFDNDFIVLEINGIHSVALNFCNCATAQTHNIQLLCTCWYPSTTTNPRTAATFRLLDHFQMYTFESKGSTFKYYQSLSCLTNNTGTCQPKDRYELFLRMSCQHHHLTSLLQAGHGHDPSGILSMKEGELAILCPACPQLGRNLPQDWENAPPNVKWLYGLFLAINANFRLCRHNKSSDQVDPGLSNGWSYFVEQTGFKEVLDASSGQLQEKSSCTGHNAVNLADTKNACGMAATGVGAIVCARHNLTCPSAVSDLQKGEKYVNMDYLFFSTLQHMSRYPSRIHLQPNNKVFTFVVPKFHLPAHILSCQTTYYLNLIKGMARTDGKAIERGWSNINPITTSTWEMGPGSRCDILDDPFGDWNWHKVCNLASLAAWQVMITEWEQDQLKSNPFESEASVTTQASVRLELSQLEGQQLSHGVDTSLHPDISPSVLVAVRIDLESLQWRLAIDSTNTGAHTMDNQLSTLQQ